VASGLSLGRSTPALLDAAARLVGLLDTPADIAALAPLARREIFYRLLTGPDGAIVRHMAQSDSRLNQIARAIVWIRAHFREMCRIEDAADVAGMSRSTFHSHFKAVTTMSPIAFRTQLRMQEARRLMVGDAMDAASAGFCVGYGSPSQFSRDYLRMFGQPPARDAIRLRAAG
jgi:AraC-like DNA-binding protein